MTKIIPLSLGTYTVGIDKKFRPINLSTEKLEQRPQGSLLVEIQPFLVQTNTQLILLDCGLGINQKLISQLNQQGFQANDIDKVLLTHLHSDHAGGALLRDDSENYSMQFPKAKYFIYRPEIEYALEIGEPYYEKAASEFLHQSPQVVFLEENHSFIDEEISFQHSGGHSPHHITFMIKTGEEKIFFPGDEASQYRQLKTRYIAKYDFDGARARDLREQYNEVGKKENWTFLLYHDTENAIVRL